MPRTKKSGDAEVELFHPYTEAPVYLHRICAPLTYWSPDIATKEDVERHGGHARDVFTETGPDGRLQVPRHGRHGAGTSLKRARGVSMIAQVDRDALEAAHKLVLRGRRLHCLVHKAGVKAPRGVAFVCDNEWLKHRGNALHFVATPVNGPVDVDVLGRLADPPAPVDVNTWDACIIAAGEGSLEHTPPEAEISDPRVEFSIDALELFALDESRPVQLRVQARLYQYALAKVEEWGDEVLCIVEQEDGSEAIDPDRIDRQLFEILEVAIDYLPRHCEEVTEYELLRYDVKEWVPELFRKHDVEVGHPPLVAPHASTTETA